MAMDMIYILCAAYNFGRHIQADYLNMGYEFINDSQWLMVSFAHM